MKIMTSIGVLLGSFSLLAMMPKSSVISSIEAPANFEVLMVTTLDPMTAGMIRSGKLMEYGTKDSVLVVTNGVKADLSKEIPVFLSGTPLRLIVVANAKVSYPNTNDLALKNTLVVEQDGSVSLKAAQ
jgi:hypothetical protein